MAEIRKGEKLVVENLMSFRGKVKQTELESIGKKIEMYLNQVGAEKVGYPITATYGIDGNLVDVEILLPINKRVASIGDYVYKEKIMITNALVAKHIGNPRGLSQTCNELNRYIMEHALVPITVGYNVTRKVETTDTEIDIYVGISPNIL